MADKRQRIVLADEWRDRDVEHEIPEHMCDIFARIPFLHPGADAPTELLEVFNLPLEGKCLNYACQGELKEQTTVIVEIDGITAVTCSAHCLQDLTIIGFLDEQRDYLIDASAMRGGRGDVVERDDEDLGQH